MLLSTDIWVGALIRRAELSGAFAMVIRKGDARAGAEAELDANTDRSRRRDPDLWVVEIDDAEGRHFLTEAVEEH